MGNKIIKSEAAAKAFRWLIVYIYHSFDLILIFVELL
jgi:hypothetical protein